MKDKYLYWILGIMALYFIVRFVMNHSRGKRKNVAKNNVARNYPTGLVMPKCPYCGADMKFYSNELNTTLSCTNPDCPSKQ